MNFDLIEPVLPRLAPMDLEPGPAERGVSSVMVFQSPHASHRPDHLVWLAPQALQVKVVVGLAMGCSGSGGIRFEEGYRG